MIGSQYFVSVAGQMICATVFGLTFGGHVTISITILTKVFRDLDSALGILLLGIGISSIIGPLTVGRDKLSNVLELNFNVRFNL